MDAGVMHEREEESYLMIQRCEKEQRCRSVRDEESDSENVRL